MKKFLRFLKKFFIILTITILVGLATILGLTYFYQDEIINFAKDHIKDYFSTDIQIGEVDFSIIKNFPDATIVLHSVFIKSSNTFTKKDFKTNTDTLLFAKEMMLQFNLLEIIQKKYELQSIHLKNANLQLLFDKKGRNNYQIFKETKDTSAVAFKLEQLKFTNFQLRITHLPKEVTATIKTNNFKLSGNFYKQEYSIKSNGELAVHSLYIQGLNYLKNGKASVNASLHVNNQSISLKKGTLNIGNLKLGVSGNYQINEESDQIYLNITGNQLSLEDLINSFPEKLHSNIANLNAKGFVDIKAEIKGGINYKTNPRIKLTFSITDGNITNTQNKVELQKLVIQGKFDNGISQNLTTSSLEIDTFYSILNDSSFYGKFSMTNFNQPTIKFRAKGSINLSLWKSFLELDTFETLKGIVTVNLNYFGKIKNLSKLTASDYQSAKVNGKICINDLFLKIKNSPYSIEKLNGKFYLKNNDIQTESKVTLTINNTPVLFSGTLQNFIAYLMLENQKINAFLNIYIPEFDFSKWNSSSEKNSGVSIPENIKLVADVAIDDLKIEDFEVKRFLSSVQLSYPVISFLGTTFQTCDGNITCNARLTIDDQNNLTLQMKGNIQQLNIKKVFQTFNNFGQKFIQEKNIQGKLNASVAMLQLRWNENQKIIEKDIILDANFLITNGQLVEFEPLYSLADYIFLSELRNIKFSDLKNDIFIQNRKIIIPNMEIKSNAFNIEVSGEHSFDNEIEYRIKLLLREWLANKAKKNKKENQEFGIEENDGLGSTSLYLVIKGTTSQYKITYDSKKMKEQVKESLKKEKQEIKTILHQEFGLFKKDSLNLKQQKNLEELKKPKFKIEWDEDNPEKDQSE